MSAAQAQCDKFIAELEKRYAAGIEAAAQEFTDQLFASLNETQAVLQGGKYKGSGPGDPPAVFERWFEQYLGFKAEGHEANIGFAHEHANAVYRWLVFGTEHVEPREGPVELYKQVKAYMVEAFKDGVCGTLGLEEAPF